ncbi:MAG: YdcF family protein [Bryobacteraceae bacterium]|nr:YdcF family protein [Bryobacteraceae bacterium]
MPRRYLGLIAALLLIFLLYLVSPWLLAASADLLVNDQPPQKADAALVLAGDSFGKRILKGADLARAGYVPLVYVSGPHGAYGYTEDELAIHFATDRGAPREIFVGLPNTAESTTDEARMLLPQLRARGVRRLLLVTSNYHTARAARTFRRTDPQMEIIPIAAVDRAFRPGDWWRSRQAQKMFFFESAKTLADFVGL